MRRGHRPGIDHPAAHGRIDPRIPDRAVELPAVVGEVRKEVHVGVERHDQRFVTLAQHAIQKAAPHVLNRPEHELFASRGIQKQRQSDWKRHFFGEEGDLLVLSVFG